MKCSLRALAFSLSALVLVACDPQDGSGVDSRVGLNGLVVDGRIAGATVWVDLNNNNDRDAGEPRAFTDSDGYFSYNPLTGMNYCALPSSAFEFRFCLRHGSSQDGLVIRARGGRDLVTGERLRGTIALQTTLEQAAKRSSTPNIMSPFTSLLAAAESAAQREALMTALGLDAADLTTDFSAAETAEQLEMLANANVIQAIQHLVSDMTGDGVSSEQRAVNQWLIMQTMASYIVDEEKPPMDFVDADIAVLTDLFGDVSMGRREIADTTLAALSSFYEELNLEAPGDDDQIEGRLLASEVMYLMVRRAIRENNVAIETTVTATVDFDALVSLFANDLNVEYDLPGIADALIDGDDVATASDDNALGTLPTGWQGQYLVIGLQGEDEVFVRYIDGKTTDTNGPMATCVRLDDGDIRYFRGNWAKPQSVESWIELEDLLTSTVIARDSILRKLTDDEFKETVENSILDGDQGNKVYDYEQTASDNLNTSGPNRSPRARPRSQQDCEGLFDDLVF
ncbi:MAG: hypothetical protein JXQ97_02070 [Natronospirillum sp.]